MVCNINNPPIFLGKLTIAKGDNVQLASGFLSDIVLCFDTSGWGKTLVKAGPLPPWKEARNKH